MYCMLYVLWSVLHCVDCDVLHVVCIVKCVTLWTDVLHVVCIVECVTLCGL